jgi:hypothetical protein
VFQEAISAQKPRLLPERASWKFPPTESCRLFFSLCLSF